MTAEFAGTLKERILIEKPSNDRTAMGLRTAGWEAHFYSAERNIMMSRTTRLQMPLVDSGQVDKGTTHNEALATADIAVCAAVDAFLSDSPPTNPNVGSSYVVGNSPTGAWAGHALALAGYTAGGWRYIPPFEGLSVIEKSSGEPVLFRSGVWEKGQLRAASLTVGGMQVVGARLGAVADPSGGAVVDSEARAAIATILARLRQHGLIAS